MQIDLSIALEGNTDDAFPPTPRASRADWDPSVVSLILAALNLMFLPSVNVTLTCMILYLDRSPAQSYQRRRLTSRRLEVESSSDFPQIETEAKDREIERATFYMPIFVLIHTITPILDTLYMV